jgi:hypothetical protein
MRVVRRLPERPSAPSDERAPDAIEPVVAWRAWFVQQDESARYRLDSVIHHCPWPVGRELFAACLTTRGVVARQHAAPLHPCQCGIYGAATLERLANYLGQGLGPVPRVQAVGLVSLWGNVLVHEHGWRASHAYPRRLWLPCRNPRDEPIHGWESIVLDLTDYNVPLEVIDTGHALDVLAALRVWEDACASRPVGRAA